MALIVDLLDILAKPARVTTIIGDELDRDPRPVRRQAPLGNRRAGRGPVAGGPDRAGRHGGHAVARRLHEVAAGRRNTARSAAAAAASRPRRPRKTISSTGCSSPTRTITSCASPIAAACTGSRSTTCRRVRARRAASRSSTWCRWSTTRRSRRSCRSRNSPTNQFVFMATAMGTVKKTPLSEFSRPRPSGIIAVDLADGDSLIGVALTDGTHDVMLFSSGGKAVRFDENDVRPMGRNAHGVRGMMLGQRPARDLDAGRRGRDAVGADGDRERATASARRSSSTRATAAAPRA